MTWDGGVNIQTRRAAIGENAMSEESAMKAIVRRRNADGSSNDVLPGSPAAIERTLWTDGGGFEFSAKIMPVRPLAAMAAIHAFANRANPKFTISLNDGDDFFVDGEVVKMESMVEMRTPPPLCKPFPWTFIRVEAVSKPAADVRVEPPDEISVCPHGPCHERAEILLGDYHTVAGRDAGRVKIYICHECGGVFEKVSRVRVCIEGSGNWKSRMRIPGGMARVMTVMAP